MRSPDTETVERALALLRRRYLLHEISIHEYTTLARQVRNGTVPDNVKTWVQQRLPDEFLPREINGD